MQLANRDAADSYLPLNLIAKMNLIYDPNPAIARR
jgi:hypothetical protein